MCSSSEACCSECDEPPSIVCCRRAISTGVLCLSSRLLKLHTPVRLALLSFASPPVHVDLVY
eukprot:618738-Amphidinium_carterae.1